MNTLLKLEELKTYFYTDYGISEAVDGVSLSLNKGEILGLVGESGCGKSVTALSILRLIYHPGKIVGGSILFNGQELTRLNSTEMREIRGNKISIIFQEPMSCLNPVMRVGDQVAEVIQLHQGFDKSAALELVAQMFGLVGIPAPEDRLKTYPHELSGGMQQRVMIAMALACNPKLMIADEPTTALDVTIQAQILTLIKRLRDDIGMSVMLITHDLGIVAETAENVAVMYAGNVVEYADVKALFADPRHPYTRGLINSIPKPGERGRRKQNLSTIPGVVPSLLNLPKGCKFHDRCEHAKAKCVQTIPQLVEYEPGHLVRCWQI